jgi:hypothetical protein
VELVQNDELDDEKAVGVVCLRRRGGRRRWWWYELKASGPFTFQDGTVVIFGQPGFADASEKRGKSENILQLAFIRV